MKQVLFIANQFPPMGGSGVQRSSKFAKYLPEFGYEPIVLTRNIKKGLMDPSLLEDVKNTTIVSTNAWDLSALPGPLSLVGKFIQRKVLIPDGERLWVTGAIKAGKKLIEDNKISYIYTTSYPYSGHLVGLELKGLYPNIPWIVDFRDEWTKNPYILDMKYPKSRQEKEKGMELQVVENCDAFITNTDYMLENFMEDYPQLMNKSYVIPNGYDDSDFNDLHNGDHRNAKFKITYTGAMYGRRNPKKLFKAVANLINENVIDQRLIELTFIGNMDTTRVEEWIREYQLEEIVRLKGYMPHKDVIKEMQHAGVLLLLIGEGQGAKNFASGKIFEYINCQRPILALVPEDGAAANIIKETKSGVIADHSSVKAIEKSIESLYLSWINETDSYQPDWEQIKKYHRRALTQRLVSIFDQF